MAEESAASLVEYACNDQVATLTLNRPQRLNAFSDELVRHLADALRRFDLDPEAQVAVICGNGRAFSSGAGVHQRQLRKREEFLEHGTDCVAAASKRPAVKSRRLIRSVRRRGRAEQVGSSTRGPLRL